MNGMLAYLKASRKWLISNFTVWGSSGSTEICLAITEEAPTKRVVICQSNLGGQAQIVNFADLADTLGNELPVQITNPAVLIIPRSLGRCYLVNRPSETNFKIAGEETPSLVDLLIMEVGQP